MLDRLIHPFARRTIALCGAFPLLATSIGSSCPPAADPPESVSGLHAPDLPDDALRYELEWTPVEPHGWSPPHGIPIDAYVPFGRQDQPRWPIVLTPGPPTGPAPFVPDLDVWVEIVPPAPSHAVLPEDATRRLLDAIAGWEPVLAGEALASLALDESLPLDLRSESALRLVERVEPGSPRAAHVLAAVLRAWMRHD